MTASIADYLAHFESLGNEPAYAERQGYRAVRYSYREVARMAYGFADELAAQEVRKGNCVVLWGPNSAAWEAAFLAWAYRGAIAVPMDDAASDDFALRVVEQVGSHQLVCPPTRALPGL